MTSDELHRMTYEVFKGDPEDPEDAEYYEVVGCICGSWETTVEIDALQAIMSDDGFVTNESEELFQAHARQSPPLPLF